MKILSVIAFFAFSTTAFAADNISYKSVTRTGQFILEVMDADLPKLLKDQALERNQKAENEGLTQAMSQIIDVCVTGQWGNVNSIDVVNIEKAYKFGKNYGEATITVKAICAGQ